MKHCQSGNDRNVYQTGDTAPRKNYQGIIAILLIVVILLCGVISVLSMLNVRMFRLLEQLQQQEDRSVHFSQQGQLIPADDISTGAYAGCIGITGQQISELYRSYNAWPEGIYIARVEPDSPAAKADLRTGDILMSVNAIPLSDEADFLAAFAHIADGQQLEMTVFRDQRLLTITVTAHTS